MERKPITVPSSSESKLVSIAKDWLAGGVSAGVSKTIVAPIGNLPTQHVCLLYLSVYKLHARQLRHMHRHLATNMFALLSLRNRQPSSMLTASTHLVGATRDAFTHVF